MSILDEIFEHKRGEVAAAKKRLSVLNLESVVADSPAPQDFVATLKGTSDFIPRLIAEVKYQGIVSSVQDNHLI